MITKMRKYSFLVFHEEYQLFLTEIKDLGVIDVILKEEGLPNDQELQQQLQTLQHIKNAQKILTKQKVEVEENNITPNLKLLDDLDTLLGKIDEANLNISNAHKDVKQLAPWGDFSWELIKKLKNSGAEIKFYACQASSFKEDWVDKYDAIKVGKLSSQILFISIGNHPVIEEADPVKLPAIDPCNARTKVEQANRELQELNKELNGFAAKNLKVLDKLQQETESKINFKKVDLSADAEADQKLMLLEGWVPVPREEEVDQKLSSSGVWYEKNDPKREDKVPVLLKNNKFSKLFEMIGEMYSLPNHREIDLTPYYAPFYAIFFGFCLGDAGYGLLLMLIGIIMSFRGKKELKPTMILVSILGFATIIFGIIGGTFFGMNLYEMGVGPYPSISARFAEGKSINDYLFNLSLILGAIQILFGMFVKAMNETQQLGWKYALGTIGWIVLIVGSIGAYAMHQMGVTESVADYTQYAVFGISGVCILLLNNPEKNVFINIGSGLYNVYNMVTGLMGDILSYIRLFALGISSAILGYVFNSLALELSPDNLIPKIIVMTLILVFGHGINLFMAALGSFVHPMRLTLVEFYKNAGFSGGGIKYQPFKK